MVTAKNFRLVAALITVISIAGYQSITKEPSPFIKSMKMMISPPVYK